MNQLSSMSRATKWLNISLGQVNLVIWSNYLPEIPFWLLLIQKLHTEQMTVLVYGTSTPATFTLEDVMTISWLFLRTRLLWRHVRTQENNFILPSLTCSFEFWASIKWKLFSWSFPFNLSFCCCSVKYPVECGVGCRLSLCKCINPYVALETVIQCQPDNEFHPSDIEPVYIFLPKGRKWLVCKWQKCLGMHSCDRRPGLTLHTAACEPQMRGSRSREPPRASPGGLVRLSCPHDCFKSSGFSNRWLVLHVAHFQ